MNDTKLDLGQAFGASWEAIKAYPGPAIGGFVLYYLMVIAMQFIPIVGFLAHIFISPPLMGGVSILALNTVDRRDPQIPHLFDGFKAYGKWMGITWLYYAITAIAMLPLGIVALIVWLGLFAGHVDFRQHVPSVATLGVLSLVGAVLLLVPLAVLIRWVFIFYAGVESTGTLEAFGLSSHVTAGRRLQLFWMFIVLGLTAMSGIVALGVGLVFTVPFAALTGAALFRQLRPSSQPEAVPFAVAPESPIPPSPYTAITPEPPSAEMPRLPDESGNAQSE
jgi:hypothetical protein